LSAKAVKVSIKEVERMRILLFTVQRYEKKYIFMDKN
jgi:hypothetical protein